MAAPVAAHGLDAVMTRWHVAIELAAVQPILDHPRQPSRTRRGRRKRPVTSRAQAIDVAPLIAHRGTRAGTAPPRLGGDVADFSVTPVGGVPGVTAV